MSTHARVSAMVSSMQSVLTASYQNSRRAVRVLACTLAAGVLVAGVGAALSLFTNVAAQPAQPTQTESPVAAMREAMARRQWQRLPELALAAAKEQHPQDPQNLPLMYAEYWWLRVQFEQPELLPVPTQATEAAARRFLARHADTYLADRLRGDWILAAARAGDFATVTTLGPVQVSNPQIGCAQLQARHLSSPRKPPAALAAEALTTFTPNDACWALLDRLVADKVLGWPQLSFLWRAALEANNTASARRFAEYLLTPAQLRVYDKILRDPLAWLTQRSRTKPTTRVQREVLVVAFARAARQDRVATDQLLRLWKPLMPPGDHAWARTQLALVAALNLDARAHQWYRDAGLAAPLTDYNHAWRVRAALRQPNIDWPWLRQAIARMSASQRAEPVWVYWDARALAATGKHDAARERYRRIASGHDYYGLLATEELGRSVTLPPAPDPVAEPDIAEVRQRPGVQRALALFRAGWRTEAVPEWNFSLRGMTDRQLRAAAELARREHLYDRVVNTSLRTAREVDMAQRFIAPFPDVIAHQAHSINLEAAWVYGLIRQESRFITDARSSAGATGLMQLMPATARWTAQRIGMTDFSPAQLNDFSVNTTLGANYLNLVLADLDGSQLLASAGYNAGPNRAKQWRARLTHPVEGAIFAETIPFTETRLYVKHVLANATWYAAMFTGQPQSLKARLGMVTPQAGEAGQIP